MKMKKAILRTLAYADIFDYPLKKEEIWQFLLSDVRYRLLDISKTLLKRIPQIFQKEGLYFLKGREKIVDTRKKRERWSEEKLKLARRTTNWLKLIPTIKMVAVTGALAMGNSDIKDDIDLLIVTSKNRLWLTRLLTVFLVELVAKRRHPGDLPARPAGGPAGRQGKNVKDKICLNMFSDEDHLRVPKKEQNLFSAHEVCQLKPLWSRDWVYERFLGDNLWVRKYLPNGMGTEKLKNGRTKKQKSFSVSQFLSFLVDLLERFTYRLQLAYMESHKTTEITEPGRIRFHPQDARVWVLKEYKKRLKILHLV